MVFSDEMGVTVNVAGTVNASPDDCGTQPGRSLPCAHPPLGVLWWLKQSATKIHRNSTAIHLIPTSSVCECVAPEQLTQLFGLSNNTSYRTRTVELSLPY